VLLQVLLLQPDASADRRREAYEHCDKLVTADFPPWTIAMQTDYARLVLSRLATDYEAPPDLVAWVLENYVSSRGRIGPLNPEVTRCALAFLGQDPQADLRIGRVLAEVLPLRGDRIVAESWTRLLELGLVELDRNNASTLRQHAERYPDLAHRLARAIGRRPPPPTP